MLYFLYYSYKLINKDSLDEKVIVTLLRDVKKIAERLKILLFIGKADLLKLSSKKIIKSKNQFNKESNENQKINQNEEKYKL